MVRDDLLVKGKNQDQKEYITIVCPPMGNPPLKYIELSLLSLKEGSKYDVSTKGRECLLLLLKGKVKVDYKDKSFSLGERKSVFEEKAYALYIPPNSEFTVFAEKDFEAALCFAPTSIKSEAVVIKPGDVRVRKVGRDNFYREVHYVLREDIPAGRLLVGETFNPPGNWSSYPPHRHDEHNPPERIRLEEVYHFRIQPEGGFALMRLYDDNLTLNEALVIENKDSVIITKGYHPVVSAPGYFLYYLWILAGEERLLIPINDPKHEWVSGEC
jgi:5-deoxy-glucuronate isomerase